MRVAPPRRSLRGSDARRAPAPGGDHAQPLRVHPSPLALSSWSPPCSPSAWPWPRCPSRNVNMVSGTDWPGGDPFLQRQNEPSVAVSTRNPMHLLAGANDYRTVDLPGLPDDKMTGDAWLGVFTSSDGGATWKSTLVPGYPQEVELDLAAPRLRRGRRPCGAGGAARPLLLLGHRVRPGQPGARGARRARRVTP